MWSCYWDVIYHFWKTLYESQRYNFAVFALYCPSIDVFTGNNDRFCLELTVFHIRSQFKLHFFVIFFSVHGISGSRCWALFGVYVLIADLHHSVLILISLWVISISLLLFHFLTTDPLFLPFRAHSSTFQS